MNNEMARVALLRLIPVLLLISLFAGQVRAENMPGSEIMLPESEVRDRFFAYMIGLVRADTCGIVDAGDLAGALAGFEGKTSVPFERIASIQRYRDQDGISLRRGGNERDVSITFLEELKTPVPYHILGYHPGSVQASEIVRFREWHIPRKTLKWTRREDLDLSDIYVFGIYEGWTIIDIDGWLDVLLGGSLDDTRIVTLVLFKHNGDWHGLAAGFGRSGEGRSGVFNFSRNKILFPTPEEFRGIGPYFRNFVADVKDLDVPLPPSSKWEQDE
jgi:hypothetical protein